MNAIRDAEKIKSILKEAGKKVVTTSGCKIIFPVRYEMVSLAKIGSTVSYVYAFFAINTLDDTYYAVHNVCTMVPTKPDEVKTFEVDGVPYYEFTYYPGSTVIEDIDVFVDNKIVGKIFNDFISGGKLPYYCYYKDLLRIFDTAKTFADANLGAAEALGISTSIVARNPDNPNQYFREISDKVDLDKVKPLYVPSSSVSLSATSTLTKLTGSYFNEGIVSALNNPTETTELLEYVLRY